MAQAEAGGGVVVIPTPLVCPARSSGSISEGACVGAAISGPAAWFQVVESLMGIQGKGGDKRGIYPPGSWLPLAPGTALTKCYSPLQEAEGR